MSSPMDNANAALSLVTNLKMLGQDTLNVTDMIDKHYAAEALEHQYDDAATFHLKGNPETSKPACPVCNPAADKFCRVYNAIEEGITLLTTGTKRRSRR